MHWADATHSHLGSLFILVSVQKSATIQSPFIWNLRLCCFRCIRFINVCDIDISNTACPIFFHPTEKRLFRTFFFTDFSYFGVIKEGTLIYFVLRSRDHDALMKGLRAENEFEMRLNSKIGFYFLLSIYLQRFRMCDVILYVTQRPYQSHFFHQFLHSLRQSTLTGLLACIDIMRNWCYNVIDDLCQMPAVHDHEYNWNCHMWLSPIENCFRFYHPAEDLVNGLANVKLIGCSTEDSPYRIHRDVLRKVTTSMDWHNHELRFAKMNPQFQVIILSTDLPEPVASFIKRQALQVFHELYQLNLQFISQLFLLFSTVFWIRTLIKPPFCSFAHPRRRDDGRRKGEIGFLVNLDQSIRR